MKKTTVILLALCLGTTASLLPACNKQEAAEQKTPSASQGTYSGHIPTGAMARFSNDPGNVPDKQWDGEALDCVLPAIDCLPEFIFVGKKVDKLIAVIAEFGTANAISDFFLSPDGIDLATEMGMYGEYLATLQSGSHNVLMQPSGSRDDLIYFFFGPAETLTREHAEYVVPVSTSSE